MDDSDYAEVLRELRRRHRAEGAAISRVLRAVQADDGDEFGAALAGLDLIFKGWLRAFRAIGRMAAGARIREEMLRIWCIHGDHIRGEVVNDRALVKALRILLPPYSGPALTLYRGDSAWNRRRRTYGLSWSAERETAGDFARGPLWRSSQGGSVLLCAEAPPEAILCAPALLGNDYGEDEYLVDRRFLRRVTVLERFSEQRM